MPIYQFRHCDQIFERFLKLADYNSDQFCVCGEKAEKIFTSPMIRPDLPAYQSPIDGKWVEGRQARLRDLARSGCVEYEPSMVQESQKKRDREDQLLEKRIEESVSEQIHNMPSSKRARLMAELEAGANIEYKRLAPGA